MNRIKTIGLLASLRGLPSDTGAGLGGSFLAVLVASVAALIVLTAISGAGTREFEADASAASFTHNPLALASALCRIEVWAERLPMRHATPATSHLLMQDPFSAGAASKLVCTHPPPEERVSRLEAMVWSRQSTAA